MIQTRESMQLELDCLEQVGAELKLIRDELLELSKMDLASHRELRLIMEQIKQHEAEDVPRIMELKILLG